jgi:heme/copper-type cytochrome/quinol oxidase subunit 2
MNTLLIYLWTRIPFFGVFFTTLLAFSAGILFVGYLTGNDKNKDLFSKVQKKTLIWIFSFSLTVLLLFPNQKDLALIYFAPKIIESRPIQKDIPELYNLAVEAMKQSLTNKMSR